MMWFSLLVLIPLCAVVVETSSGGWSGFWDTITNPQTFAALRLTITQALARHRPQRRDGHADRLGARARPLRRQAGARGAHRHPVRAADDRRRAGAAVALRAAEPARRRCRQHPRRRCSSPSRSSPCRSSCAPCSRCSPSSTSRPRRPRRRSARAGSRSSGASSCPRLVPAIAAGAALSFARAISEYGSLVLLSGNLPMRTEVTSVRILTYIENGDIGRRPLRSRPSCCVIALDRDRAPRRDPAPGGPPWLTPGRGPSPARRAAGPRGRSRPTLPCVLSSVGLVGYRCCSSLQPPFARRR